MKGKKIEFRSCQRVLAGLSTLKKGDTRSCFFIGREVLAYTNGHWALTVLCRNKTGKTGWLRFKVDQKFKDSLKVVKTIFKYMDLCFLRVEGREYYLGGREDSIHLGTLSPCSEEAIANSVYPIDKDCYNPSVNVIFDLNILILFNKMFKGVKGVKFYQHNGDGSRVYIESSQSRINEFPKGPTFCFMPICRY